MTKTLTLAFVLALSCAACAPNYSEGTRTGVVTKLSHKGLIWKSWEGSLNQGGTKTTTDDKGNSMVVANAIDFNVSDPALLEKLQAALANGDRVEINYQQWLLPPLTIDNSRVVVSVKPAK